VQGLVDRDNSPLKRRQARAADSAQHASWTGTSTAVTRAATPAARYSVLQDGLGCGPTTTRSAAWSAVGEEVMRLASLVLAATSSDLGWPSGAGPARASSQP
jgi:hypothetical protein